MYENIMNTSTTRYLVRSLHSFITKPNLFYFLNLSEMTVYNAPKTAFKGIGRRIARLGFRALGSPKQLSKL